MFININIKERTWTTFHSQCLQPVVIFCINGYFCRFIIWSYNFIVSIKQKTLYLSDK